MKKLLTTLLSSSMLSILALSAARMPVVFANKIDSNVNSVKSPESKNLRILALGDSLSAGYRIDQGLSFPMQLEKLLVQEGHLVTIVNAGVSGDTAKQGLQRMDWVIRRSGPFDAILLELGANDGLRQNSVVAMKDSLSKIIEKSQGLGMKVFLLGIKLPTNFDKKYRLEFEATFPALAKKFQIPLYPFVLEGVAQKEEYNLSDLLHPNKEGHAIIAEKLKNWLLKQKSFQQLLSEASR